MREFRFCQLIVPGRGWGIALGLLLLTMGSVWAEDVGLFAPAPDRVEPESSLPAEAVRKMRAVSVDFDQLLDASGRAVADTVAMNLFPQFTLSATEGIGRPVRTGQSWTAKVAEEALGDVILVIYEANGRQRMTGSISLPNRLVRIEPVSGTDWHLIIEIDPKGLPKEHAPLEDEEPALPDGTIAAPPPQHSDYRASSRATAEIDIMVVYTQAARIAAGGSPNVEADIDAAVTQTNLAFANSNIDAQINLVHVAEVDYEEDGTADDLNRLRDPFDGVLPEVHDWRNQYGADLVAMITHPDDPGFCGIAALIMPLEQQAGRGFSVTLFNCLGGLTFAHEVGHNLGAHHDWYVDPEAGAFKHSHGHIDLDNGFRTTMSYTTKCIDAGVSCGRITHFSNPSVNEAGEPTGIPIGTNLTCEGLLEDPDCDADNKTTFDVMAPLVAGFRTSGLPSNQNFDDARDLGDYFTGNAAGINIGADKEPGEPDHGEDSGGNSVWYQWTPENSGWVWFYTSGGDHATVMSAYTGNDVGSLSEVATSSDYPGWSDHYSLIGFFANAGTTYSIAVDGEGGVEGGHGLIWDQSITSPSNNLFADAEEISGESGSASGNNEGAGRETDEPDHADSPSRRSVWYKWTASANSVVRFDTMGSAFDTKLAVYTGDAVDALDTVASNDDHIGSLQSQVEFTAEAGQSYRIAVDGFRSEMGDLVLNWETTESAIIFHDRFETN